MQMIVGAAVLLFASGTALAQQATSSLPAPPAGPPLERHIVSLDEKGGNRLDIVYHADHTCDMIVNGDRSWHCTWQLYSDGRFCFVQDGGGDARKVICKEGRLIGRVALDGTPLKDTAPPSCPPSSWYATTRASKAEITAALVGKTLETDLGNPAAGEHDIARFTYASNGEYTFAYGGIYGSTSHGRYTIEDGLASVAFDNGKSRCDLIIKGGGSFILVTKEGHRYPLR